MVHLPLPCEFPRGSHHSDTVALHNSWPHRFSGPTMAFPSNCFPQGLPHHPMVDDQRCQAPGVVWKKNHLPCGQNLPFVMYQHNLFGELSALEPQISNFLLIKYAVCPKFVYEFDFENPACWRNGVFKEQPLWQGQGVSNQMFSSSYGKNHIKSPVVGEAPNCSDQKSTVIIRSPTHRSTS